MVEALIMVGFTLLFAATFAVLVRREVFVALIYLLLFVYAIFTEIGYAFYPELSLRIGAYFGAELFHEFSVFVALSFVAYFVAITGLLRVTREFAYEVVESRLPALGNALVAVLATHLILMASYFTRHYNELSYANASDEAFLADQGPAYFLFSVGFKMMVGVVLVLYVSFRLREKLRLRVDPRVILLLMLLEGALFLGIAQKVGSRQDVLALALGIAVFEYQTGFELVRLARLAAGLSAVLIGLYFMEVGRSEGLLDDQTMIEVILFKDYYMPSHILLASMAFEFVDPLEVIRSNFFNALVRFDYPFLQMTVGDMFSPVVSTRSASFAFYAFSEGYIAAGRLGFLYNGLVVGAGTLVWRRLASSANACYGLFMLALVSTQAANIVRSQSSYFFKDIYMVFLPPAALFFLATGLRPALRLGRSRPEADPG